MAKIALETLQQLFPFAADVPKAARLNSPIRQRTSLVDGELRAWEGACKTVLSLTCVRDLSAISSRSLLAATR
ncbi:hypothetical protein J2794_006545 [Paraburkholderia terricola]|nr:hypothetical protein [Paraburkholderia terricola]